MRTLLGWLVLILFVIALVVAVLHSTQLGAYMCGGIFIVVMLLVLLGKM